MQHIGSLTKQQHCCGILAMLLHACGDSPPIYTHSVRMAHDATWRDPEKHLLKRHPTEIFAEARHLCRQLFESLDRCEAILGKQRYIAGDELTEADLRLFQTLIRFDPVYVVSQA